MITFKSLDFGSKGRNFVTTLIYGDAVPVKFAERATARVVRPHRGNHCLEKVI